MALLLAREMISFVCGDLLKWAATFMPSVAG
jgi:hypothetical protein